MGDQVVAAIAPEVVTGLIELLRQFLKRTSKEQNEIRQNLIALQIDLGFIKDIDQVITNNNWRNLHGLMVWTEEASRLVNDASTLLRRIEDQNYHPQSRWHKQEQFHYSTDDVIQLNELTRRSGYLTKHNETVIELNEQHGHANPFGWLFCRRSG